MPIIAQQLVQITANDDLSISILDEINKCGCIKTSNLFFEKNIPLEQLKNTLRHIAGLTCDPEYEICCVDKDTFKEFVTNLKLLGDT